MDIPNNYKGRCFYHFTHIDNIESIVKYGLLSTNEKFKKNLKHVNLANENIQLRRSEMDVPCNPYGKIHDYVPFYFASRNPMFLGVLNRKNIDQPYVVYIAISIDKLLEDNVIFTDKSANTSVLPNFFENPKELDKLDWNLIDSMKWGRGTDDELHSRMAEVLVYQKVPIDWIESYVVFNRVCKEKIENIYKDNGREKPNISYEPFNDKFFYYTKYYFEGRKLETLVTGPSLLEEYFRDAISAIIDNRGSQKLKKNTFMDINDAVMKIHNNFCIIKELDGIYGLKTDNTMHNKNVSDHTIEVVEGLEYNEYYINLSNQDKTLVKLSAYLHDIGKGPKSKWENEIQKNYPDHPADSVPMIVRILSEEFKEISEYEIRKICLLVFYHDLIGDILEKGRSMEELFNLNIDENELTMLIAISLADVSAINPFWANTIKSKIPNLIKKVEEAM